MTGPGDDARGTPALGTEAGAAGLAARVLATLHRIAPDVDPSTVDRATPLVDQIDLDSMDYQNLLAALSTEHAVSIPASDVAGLTSIDAIVAYLQAHAARSG